MALHIVRKRKTTPPLEAIKETAMKTERRWLKSAIAAANEPQIALPWARGTRRRPEAMRTASSKIKATPGAKPVALAAR